MIELKNVTFAYYDKPVLRNVSFSVEASESLVIMGASGSGKSTILRLILGLECPREGQVLVEGSNICTMREKDKRKLRKKIGMVFQAGALFDSMTVGENVGYYLFEHSRLDFETIADRVTQMLGFVGLNPDEIVDKLPEELSGGMKRRVAIARALLSTDPRIMLYDEPTTGLDPGAIEKVIKLIMKLHKEKSIATIVVTHQIADAFAVADRFVVIHKGEVAFDGRMAELRESSDPRVVGFLEPFRKSFSSVAEKRFFDVG